MNFTNKATKGNLKKRLPLIVFATVIAGIGVYMLFRSQAADVPPTPPSIYLSPQNQTYAPGATFTVEVRENSGTSSVLAAQANFSYPATLVEFVSIDTTVGPFTTQAQAIGGNGQVNIGVGLAAGGTAPVAPITGDQLLARVTFRALAGGTVNMAFTSGTELINGVSPYNNLLPSLSSTRGASYVIDNVKPTVSITAPTANATINRGTTTTINVSATDNTAVSSVELYIDGVLRNTFAAAPYNFSWNTTGITFGAHTIYAIAKDGFGNAQQSSTITVNVVDNAAPTVSITAPAAGSTVKDIVTVTANATDNTSGTGVTKVEFFVDNVLRATDTTSPYSFSWDSKTVTDGSHIISAKATDGATPANVGTSSNVSVTVDNADKTAPTAPTSFRVTGNTLTSVSLAWNASTDNVGVTGYRIARNGTNLPVVSGSTLTFTDSGLTAGTSYTYTIVALDAAGNTSTSATVSGSTLTLKQGDFDFDNDVDLSDLAYLLGKYTTTDVAADLNKNGKVDIGDLGILLGNYAK